MSSLSWRSSLVVHGYAYPSGDRVPVTIGLADNAAGDTTVALRVGENGPWVLLALQDASLLELHVREVLAQRFRLTVNKLDGGDQAENGVREDRGDDGGDSSR